MDHGRTKRAVQRHLTFMGPSLQASVREMGVGVGVTHSEECSSRPSRCCPRFGLQCQKPAPIQRNAPERTGRGDSGSQYELSTVRLGLVRGERARAVDLHVCHPARCLLRPPISVREHLAADEALRRKRPGQERFGRGVLPLLPGEVSTKSAPRLARARNPVEAHAANPTDSSSGR